MNSEQEVNKFTKIYYIRDNNYKPIGCLVAKPISETFIAIGLSMCNTKHDTFNKKIGKELAIARAEEHWKEYQFKNRQVSEYQNVGTEILNFISGCVRYYKNKSIILPKFMLID